MSKRTVSILVVAFYVALTIGVTYPGYVPFNRIRPFVLGLPFSLFWQLFWIVSAIYVLTALYLWERSRNGRAD